MPTMPGFCLRWIACLLAACAGSAAHAAEFPDWAYPVNPPLLPFDTVELKHAPGSRAAFTQAQIEDDFTPPDWYPQDHPLMPDVVAHGVRPDVKPCSKCHMPNGGGHPESTELAGLTAAYIINQVHDFKSGARHGNRSKSMLPISAAVSETDLAAAAQYYAHLKPLYGRTRIVEADTVPRTRIGVGGMRFAEGGARESLGARIIIVPADPRRTEIRDWRPGFIAYVPRGSVARGRRLVSGVDGKVLPCASCHGDTLNGKDDVPRLAGRDPLYLVRQLNDIQAGTRAGALSALMQPVVAKLRLTDMIDIAAYLATRGATRGDRVGGR